jgi:hypothetical protein
VITMRKQGIRIFQRWLGLVWLPLGIACCGCGSKTPHSDKPWSNVKVSVTAGAQPLTLGEVALLATKDGTGVDAGGLLDAKGMVSIPALPGSYVAVIRPLPPPEDGAATASGAADATGGRSIPKRYRSPATSPFAVEIRKGEKNVFAFDLAP